MRRSQQAIFLAVILIQSRCEYVCLNLLQTYPIHGMSEYLFSGRSAQTRPKQGSDFFQILKGVYPGKRGILNHTHFYTKAIGQRPELFK